MFIDEKMPFTHLEKCDMMECYIVCNKNSLQARERYGVLFPTRNLPDRRYFLLLYRKFRSNENVFKKTRTKKQFIISEATEINVLAFFEANPNNAINDLKEESGLSLGTIHNILKKHKFVPFRYRPIQTLVPGDQERRTQFCQWYINQVRLNHNFWRLILWSDESNFSNRGMYNRKNSHYWSRENPRLFRPCNPQRRFSVNVWCGLIDSRIVGPVFYQGALTGDRYVEMLTATLGEFLDDLNLVDRQQILFQQDGAPAHNVRQIHNLLHDLFDGRYLSTNGPIRMPPRSPDITPMDFFFWGFVKSAVYERRYDTLEDLQQSISHAINNIDGRIIAKATRSVNRRVQKCLEQEGDVFEHLL